MLLSPIQLISSTFERLTFEVDMASYEAELKERAGGRRPKLPPEIPFECAVTFTTLQEQEGVFVGVVRLRLNTKSTMTFQHYRFDMVMSGAFVIKGTVPTEKRQNLLIINGAAVLFGICREWLRATSARCRPGVVVLPTVSFQDFLEQEGALASSTVSDVTPSKGPRGKRGRTAGRRLN